MTTLPESPPTPVPAPLPLPIAALKPDTPAHPPTTTPLLPPIGSNTVRRGPQRLVDFSASGPVLSSPASKVSARFMLGHPARVIALGFGSGLSPVAPGTVGTLWAWVAFLVLTPLLGDTGWALVTGFGFFVGWWASTVCATHLKLADPGAIVIDEILAFWLILWLLMPMGLLAQCAAFVLFRYFDAAKPGPVGWADKALKGTGWRGGLGIMIDDYVAAACTLLTIALWRFVF